MTETSSSEYIEKTAKSFLEYVDYNQFKEIIYQLSGKKWIFSQLELNAIITDNFLDTIIIYNIKELLIQENFITPYYNTQHNNSTGLTVQYISNITNDPEIELEIQKFLEWNIRSFHNDYGMNYKRINVNNLKIDYKSFANNNKNYLFNPVSTNRGVMLASLHDALICRMGMSEELIYEFFNDTALDQCFIMTNNQVQSYEAINKNLQDILNFMEFMSLIKTQTNNVKMKKEKMKEDNKAANFWQQVYSKLCQDPATLRIRNYMVNKLNNWSSIQNKIDEETFKEHLNGIADVYQNNKLDYDQLSDSTFSQIKMVINYLFCNNYNIYDTINFHLDDSFKSQSRSFIKYMYQACLKRHYTFMERLQDKYNSYIYLFLKAYFNNNLYDNRVYTNSFLKLVQSINPKDILFPAHLCFQNLTNKYSQTCQYLITQFNLKLSLSRQQK